MHLLPYVFSGAKLRSAASDPTTALYKLLNNVFFSSMFVSSYTLLAQVRPLDLTSLYFNGESTIFVEI